MIYAKFTRHNTDLRQLKGTTQKDINRAAKYMLLYAQLQEIENREVI